MTKESKDEMMSVKEAEMNEGSGHPDKKPLSMDNETMGVMKKPHESGENEMGGVKKGSSAGGNDKHLGNSDMASAVRQLNYETERSGHPSGVMKKD